MKLIQDLPEIFDEFGEQRRKSFLEIKEYKEKGVPVVGMYCAYFPTELAMAVGAIPVGLCSFANETVVAAEKELPKSMCPLVKSSYGFAIEDKCPFFHFADLVIGETTCDGKKKMYELMAEFKPIFVMELPNSQSEVSLKFWESEIVRTKEYFEDFFGAVITDESLREAVELGNQIRLSLKKLCEVMKLDPAPVFGTDIQKMITGSKYRFDFKTTPEVVNAVTERILEEYEAGKMLERRPRILVTGCPIGGDTLKIMEAIESNGGVVVAVENCSGVKTLDQMIDEENPNIYEAIARRYLATGCSIMTPNDNRIELLGRIIDEYKVDAVVEMILSGCHATGAESIYIRKFVNNEKGLPYLAIDTNYSRSDFGQISTRVAALLEMISVERGDNRKIDINNCYKIAFDGFAHEDTMQEILEKLWRYTGVPVAVLNNNKEIEVSIGIGTAGEWRNEKYVVEYRTEDGLKTFVGISATIQMKSKVKELLKVVEKIYTMKKSVWDMLEESNKSKHEECPDYLWIWLGKNSAGLKKQLCSEYHVILCTEEEEGMGLLFSNIKGLRDREMLLDACEDIVQNGEIQLAVGNGFDDAGKQNANKNMVKHLFEIGRKLDPHKSMYLIEDYYQELAVEYMVKNGRIKNYRLEELDKVRKEDQEKGSSLYETLYWYLFMKRSTARTAAKLRIHRNTLIHRVSRLNELLGLDEKDGMECERLLVAMQIDQAYIFQKNVY